MISPAFFRSSLSTFPNLNRFIATKAVILGCYSDKNNEVYQLTKTAELLDNKWSNKLKKNMDLLGPINKGKERTFIDFTSDYSIVSVVGLGPLDAGINVKERIDEKRENIRVAVSVGFKAISNLNIKNIEQIDIDDCGNSMCAAEGIYLTSYKFNEFKTKDDKPKFKPKFNLLNPTQESELMWEKGVIIANGQNIVRRLTEMPANLMTPTIFAQETKKLVEDTNVKLIIRDQEWAKSKGMNLFLAVAQGSDEKPIFLELHYNNLPRNDKPLVYVGKGVTFDSGGTCLKPSTKMYEMKGDMMGASNVVATILTLARLKAPVNIIGLIPLTENLINGRAIKPGDVFTAMNGKTVQINNTDAEGRLILADALCYASEFNPSAVIDIATLTGAISITLGDYAHGVWCNEDNLWENIKESCIYSGEPAWRLPLFNVFTIANTKETIADLNNAPEKRGGSSSVAAAFLQEFVSCQNWAHLDIAGVLFVTGDNPYLPAGCSGKPLRSMVRTIEKFFQMK